MYVYIYVLTWRVLSSWKKKIPYSLAKVSQCSSKMLVDFHWTTWHYIPEDRTLHSNHSENIRSNILTFLYIIFYKYNLNSFPLMWQFSVTTLHPETQTVYTFLQSLWSLCHYKIIWGFKFFLKMGHTISEIGKLVILLYYRNKKWRSRSYCSIRQD
jgi:hypothetical protein